MLDVSSLNFAFLVVVFLSDSFFFLTGLLGALDGSYLTRLMTDDTSFED